MNRTARPLLGKRLLVAGLGVGTLTFAVCAAFPGCNLLPPPPCPDGALNYPCEIESSDGGSDGSSDGSTPKG
ncbi:MAG: hypothetical protein JNM83_00475 [Myxococcales bacterium]|nr:hypothetical protein [Myxococcales bacterium]